MSNGISVIFCCHFYVVFCFCVGRFVGICCREFLWGVNSNNSGKIGISRKLRGAGGRVGRKWKLRGAGRKSSRCQGAFVGKVGGGIIQTSNPYVEEQKEP